MKIISKDTMYKEFCESHPNLEISKRKWNRIWTSIKNKAKDLLINGDEIDFVSRGTFRIITIDYTNKRFRNNRKINYKLTRELWEEDKEAFINRVKIFHEVKKISKLILQKNNYHWPLKRYYSFMANNSIREEIKALNKTGMSWVQV